MCDVCEQNKKMGELPLPEQIRLVAKSLRTAADDMEAVADSCDTPQGLDRLVLIMVGVANSGQRNLRTFFALRAALQRKIAKLN